MFSFSLPSLCDDALTAAGNHTFAAVKCSEGYDSLKDALEPVLAEMNELIKEGEIVVDGVTIKLDIKLGSDMKFMLIVLGLNAANSKYACMWCEVPNSNRWDMSVSKDQYTGSNMRTLDKMKMYEKLKGVESKKGCVHLPLIEIEPKDCVVDELHLFLRITDILFNNVFARLHTLDLKSKLHGTTTDDHVRRATYKIRKMGISFSVWLSQEGNGRQSRSGLKLTPLNRNEKMKVLKNLPEFFDELLEAEQSAQLAKLWIVS